MSAAPRVGIVMGSDSDWPVMEAAAGALHEFGVPYEADVVSAHRMPDEMLAYGRGAHARGLEVVIAGAGGAAHLPGMLAAVTPLPVIGVPRQWSEILDGFRHFLRPPQVFTEGHILCIFRVAEESSKPANRPVGQVVCKSDFRRRTEWGTGLAEAEYAGAGLEEQALVDQYVSRAADGDGEIGFHE